MSNSTSRHTLSADTRLTKWQRVAWLLFNVANNLFPGANVDPRIDCRRLRWREEELARLWNKVAETASPSRRVCDFFWKDLPWSGISRELGRVHALEVGCGTGIYGQMLEGCLGECFAHYLGLDITASESWHQHNDDSRYSFVVARASETHKFLSAENLIITQSALEHVEEDLLYFRQVADFVAQARHPVLQIHLIPSAECISTFPWHGIREYTRRTISKVTRLFGEETKVYLYSLGGANCNKVHRQFITWPYYTRGEDLRYTETRRYQQALRAAILSDSEGNQKASAFYALVMTSRFREELF